MERGREGPKQGGMAAGNGRGMEEPRCTQSRRGCHYRPTGRASGSSQALGDWEARQARRSRLAPVTEL